MHKADNDIQYLHMLLMRLLIKTWKSYREHVSLTQILLDVERR